jgi:Cu-processing system permease protein
VRAIRIIAAKEIRDGLRNRWIAATIVLLAALALALYFLGSAPTGTVKASALDISVVSLASLTVYLIPLIALMLSFEAFVGEFERGTMLLLLTYPVARWQVVAGKFIGHVAILAMAILVGYGSVAIMIAMTADGNTQGWQAYLAMMASSLLLGSIFIGLGYVVSVLVRERATAAGAAIGLWLVFVVLYDLVLLGVLLADKGQAIGEQLVAMLMLINPTDAYRIFNLTASEGVSQMAGMTGLVVAGGSNSATMIAVMCVWAILPLVLTAVLLLVLTAVLFQRREL